MPLPLLHSQTQVSENSARNPTNPGSSFGNRSGQPTGSIPARGPVPLTRSHETHRLEELGTRSEHRYSGSWNNGEYSGHIISSPDLHPTGITLSTDYRLRDSTPSRLTLAPRSPTALRTQQRCVAPYRKMSETKCLTKSRPPTEQNGHKDTWSTKHTYGNQRGRPESLKVGTAYLPSEPPSARYTSSCNSAGTARRNGTGYVKRRGNNMFSRLGWHQFSKKVFLQATKLVDKTTEELVKASRKFHQVPVELRELSLAMAVLDHSLIEYAQKVRKLPSKLQTEESSRSVHPINSWRHPGGLVSYSEILSRTLKSACIILQNMEHYSTFWGFLKVFKMIWILPALFIIASVRLEVETYSMILTFKLITVNLIQLILEFVRKKLYPALPASATLTKFSFRFLLGLLTWIHKVWVFWTKKIGKHVDARLVASKSRCLFLMVGLYCTYRRIQFWHRSKLKEVNMQLNKLLQYWQLCMSSIDQRQNRLDRNLEFRTFSNLFEASYERWTLRQVAPNSNIRSCFWYNVNFKMKLMKLSVDVTYATLSRYWEIFGPRLNFFPLGICIFTYYCLRPQAAELRSNQMLGKPDLSLILFVWQSFDGSFARWVTRTLMPHLGMARRIPVLFRINIPGTVGVNDKFEASLTKDVEESAITWGDASFSNSLQSNEIESNGNAIPGEHEEKTSLPNTPTDVASSVRAVASQRCRADNFQSRMLTRTPVLLLSASKVDEVSKAAPCSIWWSSRPIATAHPAWPLDPFLKERDVVFFVHGGAFLTNFCASDMRILNIWAYQVQCPVVSVDYRLSPVSSFPSPLVDCHNAYRWIVKGGLGFKVRRMVVVGDSNGCLLAVALTLKILQDESKIDPEYRLMKPAQVILSCPVLNLRPCPTTSRLLFMMDPLISHNMFHQCRKLYLPSTESYETNYYVSPLVAAPDRLLRKFPPCGIVCGGYDPFCDDAVDWAHRLHDNGVKVMFERFECMPHMFLAFGQIFPEAEQAIEICGNWMRQAFGMGPVKKTF